MPDTPIIPDCLGDPRLCVVRKVLSSLLVDRHVLPTAHRCTAGCGHATFHASAVSKVQRSSYIGLFNIAYGSVAHRVKSLTGNETHGCGVAAEETRKVQTDVAPKVVGGPPSPAVVAANGKA